MADDKELAARVAELEKALDEERKGREAERAKKEELLTEVKTERQKRREAEAARDEAQEAVRAKEEEVAKASGNADEIQRTVEARYKAELEKHQRAAQEAQQQAQKATEDLNSLVIDGGIRDHMTKAEVAPSLMVGAMHHFKGGRKFEIKDGAAVVDGVPLADAVNEWVASEGAAYKAAGHASGSGAPGGSSSTSRPLSELGDAERLKLAREGKLRSAIGA